jgi:Asp-tRNA(Asn)/Glu-tRNA(Gln) amidotransferase C subunit
MGQLDDILKYMDMLAEVPTDVEPMAGRGAYTPLREDEVKPSLCVQDALAMRRIETAHPSAFPRS